MGFMLDTNICIFLTMLIRNGNLPIFVLDTVPCAIWNTGLQLLGPASRCVNWNLESEHTAVTTFASVTDYIRH